MNIKTKTKTVITLELDSVEGGALMAIINGHRATNVNERDFFAAYSLGELECEKIDDLSRKLNSISEFLD